MDTRGTPRRPRSPIAEKARELRRHMTAAERVLWARLRGNRLDGFHFRRQHIIHGFIVDFYCHAARLIVEVDGEIHLGATAADSDRDRILTSDGLHIARFTNDQVTLQTETVLDTIATLCRTRS